MREMGNRSLPAELAAAAGLAAVLLVCICLAAALALFAADDVASNNSELARYQDEMRNLPHPAGTTAVAFRKQVGLLVGNGNHCDFFVGELRSFAGSAEKLQAHYVGQTLGERTKVRTVMVSGGEFVEAGRSHLPELFRNLANWTGSAEQDGLYVVFILAIGEDAGIDPRCH